MLKQSKNVVYVEGVLVENKLEDITYKKGDKDVEAIGGQLIVRVMQAVEKGGEPVQLDVPVHCFSNKFTNNGNENPAYKSLKTAKEEYASIAATGDPATASKLRISGTNIGMNEYFKGDALVAFPRVRGSFVNRVDAKDFAQKATFEVEAFIQSMAEEIKDEEPTGRLKVMCAIVQYGGAVDLVPFFISNEKMAAAFEDNFEVGDTVPLVGTLNFTSTHETITEENLLGDDIEKVITRRVSELVITGAKPAKTGEAEYDKDDMKNALAMRLERLENEKAKAKAKQGSETSAPGKAGDDLGF